jgi:hypothetical protein
MIWPVLLGRVVLIGREGSVIFIILGYYYTIIPEFITLT